MVRKTMKIIVIVLLVVLAAAVIAFGCFCYQNLHWWEKDMKKITELGTVEKQVTLPTGNIINYGELPGDGPALLLI
ncbi:MAG: alpha/beta hydrolase, partial [Huintestinicola sp.]